MNELSDRVSEQSATINYDLLSDQIAALNDSLDGVSETGRAFLAGAETALRATAEAVQPE